MTTETDYATNSKGNTGVALGATALGLAVLGPALAGTLGLGRTSTTTPAWVSKDEYAAGQQIAAKDSEIALLKADQTTNTKIIETYKEIMSKVNALADKVQSNKDEQYAVNTEQAVYNGTNTATVGCLQRQITQLQGLTQLAIPNSNLLPGVPPVYLTHTQLSA